LSAILASTEEEHNRSIDQTIKARNPAKKNPPSSIDQSPVSNPRSRPPAVKRSTAERNIVGAYAIRPALT
jgi:hypothetical protein